MEAQKPDRPARELGGFVLGLVVGTQAPATMRCSQKTAATITLFSLTLAGVIALLAPTLDHGVTLFAYYLMALLCAPVMLRAHGRRSQTRQVVAAMALVSITLYLVLLPVGVAAHVFLDASMLNTLWSIFILIQALLIMRIIISSINFRTLG